MSEERAVTVREVTDVDLATVKGIVLPSRTVRPMTSHHRLNVQLVQCRAAHGHKVGRKKVGDNWVNLYMHANHQLDTLFMAAGAKVLANEPVTSDDQGNPLPSNVFRHHFKCRVILPSGKPSEADCYKTWDLRSKDDGGTRANASFRRRQKEIEAVFAGDRYAKWPSGLAKRGNQESDDEFWARANAFLERAVEDEMIESRVFGGEKAEAGAKSRAIYDIFGLKMGITKEEFEQDMWIVTSIFNMEEALSKMAGTEQGQQLMALFALAQAQAFGSMGGEVIPGGAEALGTLKALQEMTPESARQTIEAQAVEVQPEDEDAEPMPLGVEETLDEMMVDEMAQEPKQEPQPISADRQGALADYLAGVGYPKGKPQANLLAAIFGPGCTLATIDALQAKISCQYGRDVRREEAANAQRTEDKMNGKMFKVWKDARKVKARQAYKSGMDLDGFFKKFGSAGTT